MYFIVTLSQWNIKNNDSFYAFPRRRNQPAWIFPELLNDDFMDPTEGIQQQVVYMQQQILGEITLKVLCEVYGRFSINVSLVNLKVEIVQKKVSRVIGVPSQYFTLHRRQVISLLLHKIFSLF